MPPAPTSPASAASASASAARSMISRLYGWSANSSSASSALSSSRTNGWSAAMISRIRASIAAEVVVGERAPAGQVEVVVEAVLDGRADRVLGPGEQLRDRLGHARAPSSGAARGARRRWRRVTIATAAPSGSGAVEVRQRRRRPRRRPRPWPGAGRSTRRDRARWCRREASSSTRRAASTAISSAMLTRLPARRRRSRAIAAAGRVSWRAAGSVAGSPLTWLTSAPAVGRQSSSAVFVA